MSKEQDLEGLSTATYPPRPLSRGKGGTDPKIDSPKKGATLYCCGRVDEFAGERCQLLNDSTLILGHIKKDQLHLIRAGVTVAFQIIDGDRPHVRRDGEFDIRAMASVLVKKLFNPPYFCCGFLWTDVQAEPTVAVLRDSAQRGTAFAA